MDQANTQLERDRSSVLSCEAQERGWRRGASEGVGVSGGEREQFQPQSAADGRDKEDKE